MRVTIEDTAKQLSGGDKATVECGYDDVNIHEAMRMIAACLLGRGYSEVTVIDGFRAWLEEHDPDGEQ